MIIGTHTFFDESSTESISEELRVEMRAEAIMLHIEGAESVDVIIEGKAYRASIDWFPISAISMKDFSIKQEIENPGIYAVNLSGLQYIRIINRNDPGSIYISGTIVC